MHCIKMKGESEFVAATRVALERAAHFPWGQVLQFLCRILQAGTFLCSQVLHLPSQKIASFPDEALEASTTFSLQIGKA